MCRPFRGAVCAPGRECRTIIVAANRRRDYTQQSVSTPVSDGARARIAHQLPTTTPMLGFGSLSPRVATIAITTAATTAAPTAAQNNG